MNDDRRRLADILAAVVDAGSIVERGRRAFDADPHSVRAAKNIVTEIGEATKALSTTTTEASPDVPWRAIVGMRYRTIHRCPEVDLDVPSGSGRLVESFGRVLSRLSCAAFGGRLSRVGGGEGRRLGTVRIRG